MEDEPVGQTAALRETLQDYLKKDGAYRFEVVSAIESEAIGDPARRDRLTMLRDSRKSNLTIVSQLGWP